jgi:hypothetical protein
LASVMRPRPDSDRKIELNFSVNASNILFPFPGGSPVRRDFPPKTGDCKQKTPLLQAKNSPVNDFLLFFLQALTSVGRSGIIVSFALSHLCHRRMNDA